ncbi:MAG: beta galactosidase jelly roll domain-containing protein [Thermoleophilaceae bacterium]|nr:beta galactosidase jelly roll domain-containing protein [Thermoleophilaceae bacterium]
MLVALAALPPVASAQGGQPGPPSGEPAPPPPPPLVVEPPGGKPLIYEGQTTRQLLGGTWYFRQDDTFVGDTERWYAQDDLNGWTAIRVPHNWNATDTEFDMASVGWYRKEFTLPAVPKDEAKRTFWNVRFEGANYRTKVWLNGRAIGAYTGYFPFEMDLDGLRKGRNTLVVKVSSLRSNRDLTHWRPAAFNGYGTGGWWNFGGLLREVYVRRIDTIDIEDVHVLPRLPKVGGPAKVEVRAYLRNLTDKDREVDLVMAVDGERIELKGKEVPANAPRVLTETFTIKRPRLWQPGRPELYPMTVSAEEGDETRAAYRLRFGVRKLEAALGGVILLNGRRLNARGASIHEDDRKEGGALSRSTRSLLVSRLRDLGATITRSHYPLHPAFLEAFDKYGILYWVDAPVYQVPNTYFNETAVRAAAKRAVVLTVRNNINHASVMTWSLANEPAGNRSELGIVGPGLARFIEDGAAAVRELDDTRLVAIDRQSRAGEPVTSSVYRRLDALGVNDYFGWYDSYKADLVRAPTTTAELSDYLDQVHAANPNLPLMITEFGAEAVRDGPASQPGSRQYQRRFVLEHLRIHASKPYVAGSIHWALRDFRVDPTWSGGAPGGWSTPPWNNKSLIEEFNERKPVYFDLRKRWRKTRVLR